MESRRDSGVMSDNTTNPESPDPSAGAGGTDATAATTPLPPQPQPIPQPQAAATPVEPVVGAAPVAQASPDTPAKPPFLRRTWVRVTGAAVAAVLLLGVGFGAGWAAGGARAFPGAPVGWSHDDDVMPGQPGDGSGRPGPGMPDDGQQGGPRFGHNDPRDDSGSDPDSDDDSGSDSDDDSGSGSDGS